MDDRTTLLILQCDDQLVGVDTAMIREVSSPPTLFNLPARMDGLRHLVLLRGEPHVVLDSSIYLNTPHRERHKMLFLVGSMAMFVDDAIRTLPLTADILAMSEPDHERPFSRMRIPLSGKWVPVLDIPAILQD